MFFKGSFGFACGEEIKLFFLRKDNGAKRQFPFSLTFSLSPPPQLAFPEHDAEGGDGAEAKLEATIEAHAVLE